MKGKCQHRRKYEEREGTAPDGKIYCRETCSKCGAVRRVSYKTPKDLSDCIYNQTGSWLKGRSA